MGKIEIPYGLPDAGGVQNRPEKLELPPFGATPGPDGEAAFPPPPPGPDVPFLPAVTIGKDGVVEKQVEEASLSGSFSEGEAKDVSIQCSRPGINGIYIKDGIHYEMEDVEIRFQGDGFNDFDGNGAGIEAAGKTDVVLEDAMVETTGVIRPCTVARDYATLTVRNAVLVGNGGTLKPDEPRRPGPGMRQPPEGLGIGGNCRTHLSMGNSHAYFYDSKIIADGWAALSTDACKGDLYLEANNCEVIVRHSGYATYSDNGAYVVLNSCKMDTEIGAILAGECMAEINHCKVEARDCLAMVHSVMGNTSEVGQLSVTGGNIHTGKECIRVKSQNAYLDLRSAALQSDSGVLLHSIVNPDAFATKVKEGEKVYGIKAVLSDMDLSGDLVHEDTDRTMTVCLKHTSLTGGVQGAILCLDGASIWTADKESQVFLKKDGEEQGQVDALEGVVIHAQSDYLPEGETILPSGGKLAVG